MDSLLRHGSLILFLVAIMLPFNNCTPTNSAITNADSSGTTTPTTGLAIAVTGSNVITVPPSLQTFNLVGTCALGPYAGSTIDWQMQVNGVDVWDSYMAGGGQYLSYCANGQFATVVRVPCPGAINNGAGCFGLTQSYTLIVRILGESSTGAESNAAIQAANPVTLTP